MRQEIKVTVRSVEINPTTHCNLRCYGCDHASPVSAEGYLSLDELERDLAVLAPVYHAFEFRLTGGEPLLHPDLLGVIDAVRSSGVSDKITIVTNGVLLHNAPEDLWQKIDKVWVSLYPGVKRRSSNEEIEALAARFGVQLYLKPTNEFNRTLLHAENRDRNLVETIYSTCLLRASCHTIHAGRYYKCSPSPFTPAWLRSIGVEAGDLSEDGVPLHGNPRLAETLASYLSSEEPLNACRFCLGTVGETVASRQMNKAAVQDWLDEKTPDPRELIREQELESTKRRVDRGLSLTGLLPSLMHTRLSWRMASLGTRVGRLLRRRPALR